MHRRPWLALAVVLLAGWALAAPAPQPLFLAVQLEEGGRRIAAPKLLGFEGRNVFVERRQPGQREPDYRLWLSPTADGARYRVEVRVQLRSGTRHARLTLAHGEARSTPLEGDASLTLTVVRVGSPAFRALMGRAHQAQSLL